MFKKVSQRDKAIYKLLFLLQIVDCRDGKIKDGLWKH